MEKYNGSTSIQKQNTRTTALKKAVKEWEWEKMDTWLDL